MKIAGWDTSTRRSSLALREGERTWEFRFEPPRDTGRYLLPELQKLLGQSGWKPGDVDLWVVGTGPGSFTGLRMGLAAAQFLAFATGKPVVGISSLRVVAEAFPAAGPLTVVAPATRGNYYRLGLEPEAGEWRPVRAEEMKDEKSLGEELSAAGRCQVVSPVALPWEGIRYAVEPGSELAWPKAGLLLELGKRKFQVAGVSELESLKPIYLHEFKKPG